MLQRCRPAGRLFCLALTFAVGACSVVASAGPYAFAASPFPQSGPALTSVIDTVYAADGQPAAGTLVITWPAFTTASGTAVAPGELDVTLGTSGALDVQLVSNVGATPANVYYSVVYQLQPNEVRTEYWNVPTTSPVTLAQVRTTPGSGTAAAPVSMQYLNTQLALKANDSAVVHLANTETITGTKSFTTPPNVPNPVGEGDVANKSYVDGTVMCLNASTWNKPAPVQSSQASSQPA